MAINVNNVKNYMSNGLNILISGPLGTGKTAILTEAANQLGYKVKYYSTATLDPYTDLVGIPVPNKETKTVEFYRPRDLDEAEIVIMDEFNRADDRTRNTLFEIIQFGTINGEPLPNLKAVAAAINPNDGSYTVDDIDPALLDRFDVFLDSTPSIDAGYFSKKYGTDVARVVKSLWEEYNNSYKNAVKNNVAKKAVYLSPRRMDMMVSAFQAIPKKETLRDTLTPGAIISLDQWTRLLAEAFTPADVRANSKNSKSRLTVNEFVNMPNELLRSSKNILALRAIYKDGNLTNDEINRLNTALANALSKGVGPARIAENWGEILQNFTDVQVNTLMMGWTTYKKGELRYEMRLKGFTLA